MQLSSVHEHLAGLATRAGLRDVPARSVAAIGLVVVVGCMWAAWRWWPDTSTASGSDLRVTQVSGAPSHQEAGADASVSAGADSTLAAAPTPLVVHVSGKVRHPGVYELPVGSRVVSALDAAGGVISDGVADAINLARPLVDGEQIVVPSRADIEAGRASVPQAGGSVQAGGATGSQGQGTVDVNTADVAALDTLPGVGPATAQRIIAEREANGRFKSIDDLARVPGIGPKRLEQLKDLVTVR